jgi:farnesyl-diphosphate farnesyltransferase
MSANDNKPPSGPKVASGVEAWSGKDKGDENFPVGSALIEARLRPHVHAYYSFARNADDIADNPALTPDDKIARLDAMEAVLLGSRIGGSPSAAALRASLAVSGVDPIHARELLIAFRQDAVKTRYATWDELLNYCRYSAAPVGRYMLALHGEAETTWPASDALCAALQILNHMQDCAGDLRTMDRCYIPQDFLAEAEATTDDIARPETTPGLRAVFDRMLALTRTLNQTATALPGGVRNRRFRVETAVICHLSARLLARLAAGDPLATPVKLSKTDFLLCTLKALPRLA